MDQRIMRILMNYKHSPIIYPNINYINIPVTILTPTEENAELFNEILDGLTNDKAYHKIVRTKSGGISTKVKQLLLPAWDFTISKNSGELTILNIDGMWRIQFRAGVYEDEKGKMSGRVAFNNFKKLLIKYNINLEDYAVDNGLEIKKTIEKPLIGMTNNGFKDVIFENVNHIDFHNSYPGGLINTHPEFGDVIRMCYKLRKKEPKYKAILNFSIGFMQSKWCGYKYAHLSRDAILDNNNRIRKVAEDLKKSGRLILSYNTDGIWYKGEPFHGDLEGNDVGQWENDHINCTFRMKSGGSYEYIEQGVYHPVVRGYTKLDRIKPRDQWCWGDIYQADIVTFYITEHGIKYEENSIWVD